HGAAARRAADRHHPEGVPRHDLSGNRGSAALPAEHGEDAALSGVDRIAAAPAAAGEIPSRRTETAMTTAFRCDDKERLVSYLYGEASDADREAVEAHL